MSIARIFRFILGVIVGAILLAVVLPFLGVPRSHYLPPSWVYAKADGVTRGVIFAKYYDITNNPFNVGGKQYFVKYRFRAKSPGPRGEPGLGPAQIYFGIVRISNANQSVYEGLPLIVDSHTAEQTVAKVDIPTYPLPVRVRYEKTYPYINGIDALWGGRNIAEGSNNLSGWIIWSVATVILGYFLMMLFERFSNKENI